MPNALVLNSGVTLSAPGAAPLLPDITSLLWSDWSDSIDAADGSIVSAIPDVGGSLGIAVDQVHGTTSRRPTLAKSFQGGHDWYRFTRANSQYIATPNYATVQQAPLTQAVIYKRGLTTASGSLMSGGAISGTPTHMGISCESATYRTQVNGGGALGTINDTAAPDTGIHIAVAVYDGAASRLHIADATTEQIYLGTLATTDPAARQPRMILGAGPTIASWYFDGWLTRPRVYGRALTTADATALIAWYRTRFALT